jgi:hypothetical protein
MLFAGEQTYRLTHFLSIFRGKLSLLRLLAYVLTDKGDTNKFVGIEIKEITKNKFKLSQTFLIEQIVKLLGLGQNEFDVHTNTKINPFGKPLLNIDLEGKPRKKD